MDIRVQTVNIAETAAELFRMGQHETVYVPIEDALERGGRWVTYEARDRLRGQHSQTYLPHYGRTISSETERGPGMVSMFVGPEADKPQGGMGPGVEFGSVNAPPLPHLFDAFDARIDAIIDRAGRNLGRWR